MGFILLINLTIIFSNGRVQDDVCRCQRASPRCDRKPGTGHFRIGKFEIRLFLTKTIEFKFLQLIPVRPSCRAEVPNLRVRTLSRVTRWKSRGHEMMNLKHKDDKTLFWFTQKKKDLFFKFENQQLSDDESWVTLTHFEVKTLWTTSAFLLSFSSDCLLAFH